MTLTPPAPAAPQALATGLEPLLLPPGLKLSPEQFALVCEANPEAVLELTAAGQVIAMNPTGGETSRRNARLLYRLQAWAERRGGWVVFDSSGGFRLPVAARLLRRSWLRAQPRCGRGAAGALAGAHARTTPRLPALVPRPGGGAGEPLRSRRLLRRS